MKPLAGHTFGIVGALAAFPRRLAAREVAARGGQLRRGVGARHHPRGVRPALLDGARDGADRGAGRGRARGRAAAAQRDGFLRLLGAARAEPDGVVDLATLVEQSGLEPPTRRPAGAVRCLRARRRALLVPRPDPRAEVCRPDRGRRRLGARSRARCTGSGPVGVADGEVAARRGPGGSRCGRRRRACRARRPAAARLGGRRAETRGATSTRPRPPRRRASTPRRPCSTGAASRSTRRRGRRLQPGQLPAGAGRARPRRRRTIARAVKLDPGFVEAWFNLGRAAGRRGRHRRGAAASAAGRSRSIRTTPTRSTTSRRSSSTPATSREARRWWARYLELDRDSRLGADGGARHRLRRPAPARDRRLR